MWRIKQVDGQGEKSLDELSDMPDSDVAFEFVEILRTYIPLN